MRILPLLALSCLWLLPLRGQEVYRCPPCGMACDGKTFAAPGLCPACGMPLVKAGAPTKARPRVAILLFNGVEIIDFTGPYEVFGAAGFDVFTVAAGAGPITTDMGMSVTPRWTFANCPPSDLLLIPGGAIREPMGDPAVDAWIRVRARDTGLVLSVCNGAFLLAKAGLLDGLEATTTRTNLARLRATAPKVKVLDDRRWVDNGRIICAGGLSAGIDGALHGVERLEGKAAAREAASELEYRWDPDPRHLPLP